MKMHESAEMYLETILILSEQQSVVRSIDICNYMNFSKPSVSRAVGILKREKMIEVDKKGSITLTTAGEAYAKKIYERHTVLTQCLMALGVDEETASQDACKIEHIISDLTFEKMKKLTLDKDNKK